MSPPPNEIYQFSIISALMSGLASASSSIPISTLLSHGTFGMGTFESMDGEMLILDSTAYQFHADGSIQVCTPEQLVPFAIITPFVPQLTKSIALREKKSLLEEIELSFPEAKNAFVLFKVEGLFKRVKIRAVHRQAYSGQKLAELAEGQAVSSFEGVRGTVVGVRSPGWSVGISVVGVHAHFVDEERKIGGHILEIEAADGTEVKFEGSLETLGLYALYEPEDRNVTIDIVVVHGLGGEFFSTWTDKASGCLWLRDLPDKEALKGARIMTFGYDARAFLRPFEKSTTGRTFTFTEALLFDLSNARIDDQARSRPLIFVGHSLGGNVIKSALVGANNQQNLYGDILKSTQCLVFFGTPHQGADAAVWGTYLGNLAQEIGIHSTEVTQELMRWSNPLVVLRVNFAQLAPRYLIRTFFETMEKYNVLVVPEMSARFGTDKDQAVRLDADHLDICKFGNGKTPNALRVLQSFAAISKLMEARVETGEEGANSLEERLETLRRSA